jgi:hypothetical protein
MEDLITKIDNAVKASPEGLKYADFHATLSDREKRVLRNAFKLAEQRGIAMKRMVKIDGVQTHMILPVVTPGGTGVSP